MQKLKLGPTTAIFPMPCVLVSSGFNSKDGNFSTIAYAGVVNGMPPMIAIGVRPERHLHGIIVASKAFGINVPTIEILPETDMAGKLTGRHYNKFDELKITAFAAPETGVILLGECALNLECKLVHTLDLPSHTMFVGEVVATYADEDCVKEGKLDLAKRTFVAYGANSYWAMGGRLHAHGFSK